VSNRNGDATLSLAAQIRRRFGAAVDGGILYGYVRARDRMSLLVFEARSNIDFTPLDGTLADRRIGPSYFEIPHRVQAYLSAPLPAGLRLSLRYSGSSGVPFTYTVEGDANADGLGTIQSTDPVYVPAEVAPGGDIALVEIRDGRLGPAGEAEYARLNGYIEAEPCLRSQRGKLLGRNSCRNPWFGTLSARLTKSIPATRDHVLDLAVDLYNALNLVSRDWGRYRATSNNNAAVPLLRLVGYDEGRGRGEYQLALPARNEIIDLPSRWQVELSVRYRF
jgi:hypothetical protein